MPRARYCTAYRCTDTARRARFSMAGKFLISSITKTPYHGDDNLCNGRCQKHKANKRTGHRFIKVAMIANLCWNGSCHDNRWNSASWLADYEESCHSRRDWHHSNFYEKGPRSKTVWSYSIVRNLGHTIGFRGDGSVTVGRGWRVAVGDGLGGVLGAGGGEVDQELLLEVFPILLVDQLEDVLVHHVSLGEGEKNCETKILSLKPGGKCEP